MSWWSALRDAWLAVGAAAGAGAIAWVLLTVGVVGGALVLGWWGDRG